MPEAPRLTENESAFWSHADAVAWYELNRNSCDELYASEKQYINASLFALGSHLDVGCAAGGLAAVALDANPAIRFKGVDVSPAMVAAARRHFPQCSFAVMDGAHLDEKDATFASVTCLGVLHLACHWRSLLAEMWRVAGDVIVFDVRLSDDAEQIAQTAAWQTLSYTGATADAGVKYTVLTGKGLLRELQQLEPHPLRIEVSGYMHAPSAAAHVPLDEMCMTMCCLWKSPVSLNGKPFEPGEVWAVPVGR